MKAVMPEAEASSKAKFDAYAESYDKLHQQGVAASGEDSEYFTLYKLDCLKRLRASGPVMDYGCGIGNLTTHLASAFSEVHGFDPSPASVEVARKQTPGARFWSEIHGAPSEFFGTVVLSCVLHHIPPQERAETLKNALRLLQPGGRLVVFEHNPLNPLTRKVVRDCPFDDDAILLWPRELR
ncbi:MAG TPA: class I SAM-dependent methyltransferase, partial [Polyangiaceae bacterium]|nr:class I SAM-dependent methyltransferase [Polyangiaceae bacterium]